MHALLRSTLSGSWLVDEHQTQPSLTKINLLGETSAMAPRSRHLSINSTKVAEKIRRWEGLASSVRDGQSPARFILSFFVEQHAVAITKAALYQWHEQPETIMVGCCSWHVRGTTWSIGSDEVPIERLINVCCRWVFVGLPTTGWLGDRSIKNTATSSGSLSCHTYDRSIDRLARKVGVAR